MRQACGRNYGRRGDADTTQAVSEITNCAGSQAATSTDTKPAA